jgi:aryl-alcohol dehydrogenase-like predicted oxidoreductase
MQDHGIGGGRVGLSVSQLCLGTMPLTRWAADNGFVKNAGASAQAATSFVALSV